MGYWMGDYYMGDSGDQNPDAAAPDSTSYEKQQAYEARIEALSKTMVGWATATFSGPWGSYYQTAKALGMTPFQANEWADQYDAIGPHDCICNDP